LGGLYCDLADVVALGAGQLGGRSDFDQLLIAALDRTIALEQMITLPKLSPMTWTSIWRGLTTHFSMNTSGLPNALWLRKLRDHNS